MLLRMTTMRRWFVASLAPILLVLGLVGPANAGNTIDPVDHEDCWSSGGGDDARVCLHVWIDKDDLSKGGTLMQVMILTSQSIRWQDSPQVNGIWLRCWNADNVVKWSKPATDINLGGGDTKFWTPNQHWDNATRITCGYYLKTHVLFLGYEDPTLKVAFDLTP